MEIKKRKIEGFDENRLKELLFPHYEKFGFSNKEEIEKYFERIKNIIQNRYIYTIPKKGSYVVFLKDNPEHVLAFFGEERYGIYEKEYRMEAGIKQVESSLGTLHKAQYSSPLKGKLYIIGRRGVLKVE